MIEYILVFHDDRDLYRDKVVKLQVKNEDTYDKIFNRFNDKAIEVLDSLYGFGDGEWRLLRMDTIDEIDTITYE